MPALGMRLKPILRESRDHSSFHRYSHDRDHFRPVNQNHSVLKVGHGQSDRIIVPLNSLQRALVYNSFLQKVVRRHSACSLKKKDVGFCGKLSRVRGSVLLAEREGLSKALQVQRTRPHSFQSILLRLLYRKHLLSLIKYHITKCLTLP